MKRRSTYREKMIRNYYENRDDLMIQSLSEVVSELYLASNDRARAALWRRAETAMRNLKVAEAEVARILQNHDLGALAKLVSRELLNGFAAPGRSHARCVRDLLATRSERTWQKGLWKLGFHRVLPDRPSTLMVEPTNVCNLHCPACPTGAGILNRPPRAMSFDEFRNILDQALDPPGYLRRVTLFNYGEPFLCKDLLRMVRCAADRGLETFTSTNGQFFGGEKIADEVVASGLTELLVCLDGADQETISRYRKDANFDEILSGIRRILAARAKAGARRADRRAAVHRHEAQ